MKRLIIASVLLLVVIIEGCGVKGKPQPPLQEPFISSGNYQVDLQKKEKQNSHLKDKDKTFNQKINQNER